MTVTIPHPRDGTASLPPSFTVCVSASPEERGRLAAALDGHGMIVLVPDAQTALDLLMGAAVRDRTPDVEPDDVVRLGRLEVDRRRATVTWGRVVVDVSHLELEVLACLATTPGVVWSYERLHEVAWGSRYVGDRDSVYSLVKRLRRKLSEAGVELGLLAVRGIGFQLVPHPRGGQTSGSPTPLDGAQLTGWGPEAAG
jgi:DNA-binding response OmpR family regulator